MPKVFLCHASEDKGLVKRIAEDLHAKGIDTFYDGWEIKPGDSIRQKIDEGLAQCTHFLVVLSPNSVSKEWVKAEMDAGFLRKLSGRCLFIVLRYNLTPQELPPLLQGLHSPSLESYERDIESLISVIHGVTIKPALGPAPKVMQTTLRSALGLSPAAEAMVKTLVEESEDGMDDPRPESDELREKLGLNSDDFDDAVDELERCGFLRKHSLINSERIHAEAALFVAFDRYFKEWDPEIDAHRIAADLFHGKGDDIVSEIAARYGWLPRRMNPAVNFLIRRNVIDASETIGCYPWRCHWISKTGATRRFVRDQS